MPDSINVKRLDDGRIELTLLSPDSKIDAFCKMSPEIAAQLGGYLREAAGLPAPRSTREKVSDFVSVGLIVAVSLGSAFALFQIGMLLGMERAQ